MTFRRLLVLSVLVLALAACGQVQWPPAGARPQGTDRREPIPSGAVAVVRGDTVYGLSRRHGVSVRAIIEANRLRPPYHLQIGQKIVLPRVREHRVKKGETLYGISRRYGVDVYDLARTNRIGAPYTIRVGQALRLPGHDDAGRRGASRIKVARPASAADQWEFAPKSPTGPGPVAVSQAKNPRVRPVVRKEAAPPDPPGRRVDGARPAAKDVRFAALPRRPDRAARPQSKPAPRASTKPAPVKKLSAARRAGGPARVAAGPARGSAGKFLWPVRGKVLSGFGPMSDGLHNDGINIVAPRGAPVRAAENGVVAYHGNELRGYGNLLLIRHADGWVSAYAHTERILVQRGDSVRRGHPPATALRAAPRQERGQSEEVPGAGDVVTLVETKGLSKLIMDGSLVKMRGEFSQIFTKIDL